jgi:hypothetical protein
LNHPRSKNVFQHVRDSYFLPGLVPLVNQDRVMIRMIRMIRMIQQSHCSVDYTLVATRSRADRLRGFTRSSRGVGRIGLPVNAIHVSWFLNARLTILSSRE